MKLRISTFAMLGSLSLSTAAAQTTRPNIVLFLVDDQGWQDTSVPFWQEKTENNRKYDTPNMERLAARGTKFTHAYAAPVSSPTRVSLMTGMSPARHRVTNWTLYKDQATDQPSDSLFLPHWNIAGLQPVQNIHRSVYATTLPELLRQNGYHTIHCGKAHFGAIGTPGENPLNLGFDVNIAGHAAGGLASYLGEKNFGNNPQSSTQSPFAIPGLEQYWGKDIFVTEALTQEAVKALDTAQMIGKPFFLYMSHYAVHAPFDKDVRYFQKYKDRGLDDREARYAALVEGMDKSLGDLMYYLDQNKLTDNTVIIFMSDNGGLTAVGRGGERAHVQNYPLNSGKGSSYEGGVRVPMIVTVPKSVDTGVNCQTPVEICDFMPTILELAGVKKYKTVQTMDGRSIVPLLKDPVAAGFNRALFWHFPNVWDATGPGIGTFSSILKGDWKLIYYYDTQTTELFNIKEDIFEVINQATNPATLKTREQLARELTKYLRRTHAQLPRRKNGQWCDYPDGRPYHDKSGNYGY